VVGEPGGQEPLARAVAALSATAVVAPSCHFLLALPGGRLRGRARRAAAGAACLAALAAGLPSHSPAGRCQPERRP
jgi:hypothetical protein